MSDTVSQEQGNALVPEVQPTTRSLAAQFANTLPDCFASWPIATEPDRIDVLRAFARSDLRVEDTFGLRLPVVKFVCHEVQVKSVSTGQLVACYRSVLFLADGRTVSTTSNGVFQALKRVTAFLGCGVWGPPVLLEIKQVGTNAGGRCYELHYHGREGIAVRERKGNAK